MRLPVASRADRSPGSGPPGYWDCVSAQERTHRGFPGEASGRFGLDTARRIAKTHPTIYAALCFNDLVALGMAAGFAEQGVTFGKHFRLAGLDDLEESAQAWPPRIFVRCDMGGFGRRVARDLLRRLLAGERPTPESDSDRPQCTPGRFRETWAHGRGTINAHV